MSLTAPDTNPEVVPTPVRKQGGVWVGLSTLAGLLLAVLPLLPIPDVVKPYLPAITAGLGWLAHNKWGPDEYAPAPTPPPNV